MTFEKQPQPTNPFQKSSAVLPPRTSPTMTNLLQKLRQKPKFVQSQVAFLVALVSTGIVATVWVTTLPARFGGVPASSQGADTLTATDVMQSAKGFVDTVSTVVDTFKNPSQSASPVQNPFEKMSAPTTVGAESKNGTTASTSTGNLPQKSIRIETTTTSPQVGRSVIIATSSVEEKIR